MKVLRWFSYLSFLLLFFPVPSHGSSFSGSPTSTVETLRNLVAVTPLIVHGTVQTIESRYGSDRRFPTQDRIIVTDATVRIQEKLKGEGTAQTLTVQVPGGCIKKDDRCFVIDIDPSLAVGEEVILFLHLDQDHHWIIRDPLYGKQILHQGLFYPLELPFAQIKAAIRGEDE